MKKRPDKTTLMDQESATEIISNVLSVEQPKTGAKVGRPVDAVKSKRVRFNTMIDAQTKRRVKVYAAQNDISLADVIDQALKMYLEAK